MAAAALLEELLKSVDMSEFLQPGKSKQQLPLRVRPAAQVLLSG